MQRNRDGIRPLFRIELLNIDMQVIVNLNRNEMQRCFEQYRYAFELRYTNSGATP